MNKQCYRHVFNQARGMVMAVAEVARSRGKAPSHSRAPRGVSPASAIATFSPFTVALRLLLGSICLPAPVWADIVADTSAPDHQRATVLVAPNGVPLVNIQTPSAAGVSRNTYTQFDVEAQGAILNNARHNTQTQLGGWVPGNPWLATGSATVILNEVNSNNPSALNGTIEVGGQRAQVVIANPAGITCADCGFINANRATLTTGTAIMTGGNLEGYRVEGGVITIAGAHGLDTSSTDYTDLIAQSIQVNASIWAKELAVTAGNNEVAADHSQITDITTAGGSTPAYAIDVAQLGGMYAGKITLVGTQEGVGVRHGGNLGASAGNVVVTADGRLESSGNIWSNTGKVQLTAQGDIDHRGVIESQGDTTVTTQGTLTHRGEIDAKRTITLTTQGDLHNQGRLLAGADLTATAYGTNSQLTTSKTSTLAAGVQEDDTIGETGSLTLSASGAITAQGKHYSGDEQTMTGDSVSLAQSDTAANTVRVTANTGDIEVSGATITAHQTLSFDTTQRLTTDHATVSAETLTIEAHSLSNVAGELHQTGEGDLSIDVAGDLDNTGGTIATNSVNLTIEAVTLTNHQGRLSHAGAGKLAIDVTTLTGEQGTIETNGDLDLTANTLTLNQARTTSQGRIAIDSDLFEHQQGTLIQVADTDGSIIASTRLENTEGLLASDGKMAVTVGDLNNQGGTLQVTGADNDLIITATGEINNRAKDGVQGEIYAAGEVTITAASVDNRQSQVEAGNTLSITTAGDLANTDGTLIAGQMLAIESHSLTGDGKLYSEGDIDIQLTSGYTHTGELVAHGNAKLHTTGTINHQSTMTAGQLLDLHAATIETPVGSELKADHLKLSTTGSGTINHRGVINGIQIDIDAATLNNVGSGRIYGDHVSIRATTVNNNAENNVAAVIAARSRLDLGADTINNRDHALLFSAGALSIGGDLDSHRHATDEATTLNNTSARIESLGDMRLSAGVINNANPSITTTTRVLTPENLTEYKLNAGDVYQPRDKTTRYSQDEVNIYKCEATCITVKATGDTSDAFTDYRFTRTVSETIVTHSDPAKIVAGGDLLITAETLNNEKSQVMAGGNLTGSIGTLNNRDEPGDKTTTDVGTATSSWRKRIPGWDYTKTSVAEYTPAPVVETMVITSAVYKDNTAVSSSGTEVTDYTKDTDTPLIDHLGNSGDGRTGSTVEPIVRVSANDPEGSDGASDVLTGGLNLSVPNPDLFSSNPDAPNGIIIETDPAFADYRTWLNSEYLLNAMSFDPASTQKRLGDGFYEQRLIREQVAMLTGRRFLEGYSNDEVQYQQLMEAGALFAQAYQLLPGVALSAEQMARLTSDMVWLVEKTIILADGQTTQALVPQVYVRVEDGDLSTTGGLIAADNALDLNISHDLNNFGTIAGRRIVDVSAENINTLGGRLRGDIVVATATGDINTLGGRIEAKDQLTLTAGRDLRVASTTRTQTNAQGSRTNIDRVAGLYVSDRDGLLTASAGRDLMLRAAGVTSAGRAQLLAGHDVRLDTVTTAADHRVTWDSENYNREYGRTEIGSDIQSRDTLQIQAERNLLVRAAQMSSLEGALEATAAGNLTIEAGENLQGLDAASKHTSRGFLSSRTLKTRDDIQHRSVQSSNLSGRTIGLHASQDLSVIGSHILGDGEVNLSAQRDISIDSSDNRTIDNRQRNERKSGVMSTGGLGVSVGTTNTDTDHQQRSTDPVGSTVGSLTGDIRITANHNATIAASDLISRQGDINITADSVDITPGDEVIRSDIQHRTSFTGVTASVSGGAADSINTVMHSSERAQETDNNALAILHGWKAANAMKNLPEQLDDLKHIDQDFANPDAVNPAEGEKTANIDVAVSVGSSRSESHQQTDQHTAQGSTLSAGGTITMTATGERRETENSGDIRATGAYLSGNNVTLDANNDLILRSAENTSDHDSTHSSRSAGVGVSFGSSGLSVLVEGSKSEGFTQQSDDQYLETQIIANNTASLRSGNDTTLEGAQVKGQQITAHVGNTLTVTSQQDQSHFTQENNSVGGKLSVGVGGGTANSLSLNASELNANANHQAVQEQSGFLAGDGGYDIQVEHHTGLTGGAIVSTATEEKNRLSTDTFSTENIQNVSEYEIESKSASGTIGGNDAGVDTPAYGKDSDRQENTTYSAISAGTLDVRSGDTAELANVKDSQEAAHTILDNRFSQDKITDVQEQQEIQQLAGQVVGEAVADFAQSYLDEADQLNKQAEALQDSDPEEATRLRQEAQTLTANWGEDSYRRQLLTATIAGGIGGNLSTTITHASTSILGQEVAQKIGESAESNDINQAVKYIAHAALGCGVGAANNGSCTSGAIGGVAGEVVGDQVRANIEERITKGDVSAEDLARWQSQGVDMAQLAGGVSALLLNDSASDFQTGATTAGNAAEHNGLLLIPIALAVLEVVDKALTVKEAYDLAQALHEGDNERAQELATGLGVGVGTEAVPGNKIAQKVWQAIKKSGGGKVDDKLAGGKSGTGTEEVPNTVTRQDNDFSATTNHKDKKNSYIDEDGNLTSAGPENSAVKTSPGKTASDNEYFTNTKQYQAPDKGTGYTYKVFQQDINPDLKVEVKNPVTGQTRTTTNRELMQNGKAPYVVRNEKTVRVELHHSRQNAEGPLFELSSPAHNVKTGQGAEALHPYKTNRGRELNGEGSGPRNSAHPDKPVDRTKFDKDRDQYWQDRIKEIDGDN